MMPIIPSSNFFHSLKPGRYTSDPSYHLPTFFINLDRQYTCDPLWYVPTKTDRYTSDQTCHLPTKTWPIHMWPIMICSNFFGYTWIGNTHATKYYSFSLKPMGIHVTHHTMSQLFSWIWIGNIPPTEYDGFSLKPADTHPTHHAMFQLFWVYLDRQYTSDQTYYLPTKTWPIYMWPNTPSSTKTWPIYTWPNTPSSHKILADIHPTNHDMFQLFWVY